MIDGESIEKKNIVKELIVFQAMREVNKMPLYQNICIIVRLTGSPHKITDQSVMMR